MPKPPAEPLLARVRLLLAEDGPARLADAELVRRFAATRDAAAFEALVRRHGPTVLAACRRLLPREDAEDAFQAAFLLLARKAGSLRRGEAVGCWLYGVARRLALKARRREQRRLRREARAVASRPADPLAEMTVREAQAALDEELARLPEKYRAPLVLCCLGAKTRDEAARDLGCSTIAIKNRLQRGRELLRARLSRRGLTVPAAFGTALVTEAEAQGSLPGGLVQAALRAAQDGGGAVVPARVADLAASVGGERAWRWVALAALLTAGLAAGLGAFAVGRSLPAGPFAAVEPPEAKNRPDPEPPAGGPRVDRYGDPLPRGAVARLGTLRFRAPNEIDAVALSPDGRRLAVASRLDWVLMDAARGNRTGHLTAELSRPQDRPVVFSPDGKRLAGGKQVRVGQTVQGVVRVWDPADAGKPKDYAADHAVWVGWSADNEPLAVCLEAGALRLDELTAGRSRRFACKGLAGPGMSEYVACAYAPTGRTLAAAEQNSVVHVWDTESGRERCAVRPGGGHVTGLALSPDGRLLATLKNQQTVHLWDATTGAALHALAPGQRSTDAVAFTPDGKALATAGNLDVRFWDVATGRERGRTREPFALGPSLSISADGKTLVTAEAHGTGVHVWDVATGERKAQPDGHRSRPHGVVFLPDGRRAATGGSMDGTVRFWDLATGEPLTRIERPGRWVRDLALSPDGSSLFLSWSDEDLWVCDTATGERRDVLKLEDPDQPGTRQSAVSMYLSSDGKTLVALSFYYAKKGNAGPFRETLVTGWDAATRKQLFRRRRPGIDTWFALSPDARVLAVPEPGDKWGRGRVTGEGPMRLEDVATGEQLLTFPLLEGQTWPLAFSPDGRLLASNNWNAKRQGKAGEPAAPGSAVHLWEVATGAELLELTAGESARAAFSPDGRLLAAAGPAHDILVWDLAAGRERLRFQGIDAEVTYLAFAPDGRRLVSGFVDSTLLVWDVGPRQAAPADKPGPAELEKAWTDLAGADAPRAFRARWTLAAAPDPAIALLKARLRPARGADPQRLRRLVAELDGERFEARDKAQAALQAEGEAAGPALREALTKDPSPEVRRRVQAVLDGLPALAARPEGLRAVRALAVLESIATPPARQLVEELAAGVPEARLTREAKASLGRFGRKP